MPKIIKDLQSRLKEEARRQIETNGYSTMTVRSVAKGCGVGTGTVYNYYDSKDDLVAACLLEDWDKCLSAIYAVGTYSETPLPVVRCIQDQLFSYGKLHETVFQDPAACASVALSFRKYHAMLRSQLALPLRKFCKDDFTAEFIAEAILTWTMVGKSDQEIYGIVGKLFL